MQHRPKSTSRNATLHNITANRNNKNTQTKNAGDVTAAPTSSFRGSVHLTAQSGVQGAAPYSQVDPATDSGPVHTKPIDL